MYRQAEQNHNLCFWHKIRMHHNFPSSEIDSKFVIQLSAAKYLLISLNFVNGRAIFEDEHDTVTEKDLEHLLQLLDNKESGDTAWQNLMERTTSNMTYKAWRREPEEGPIMYCSRTIFEDATPELVRDFFWDGDFRLKWDPMLAYSKTLDEFPQNGTTIVHWIKKFPFFCSDREYIFGGRIWESGKTYYCVTKVVCSVQQQQQQLSLVSQTSWGRLEMKPTENKNKKHKKGTSQRKS
ncbi:hypothetical protein PAHAL_2G054000 [Panicum hallii]|uniref:START domain-containing protein n=1 Tax=Panicum hallii TaxID=206008 RepID=A0A2T8KMZ6_9POAL|nr:hypothetical protein PAHAL_2G054000 [Panicum hallii]